MDKLHLNENAYEPSMLLYHERPYKDRDDVEELLIGMRFSISPQMLPWLLTFLLMVLMMSDTFFNEQMDDWALKVKKLQSLLLKQASAQRIKPLVPLVMITRSLPL